MRLHHKIALMAATCFMSAPYLFAAIPADYTGKPFCCDTLLGKPQQIPGIVKAVYFDSGGEGVAFHDAAGNQGGSMRLKNGQQIQADLAVDMQSYSGNDWDVVGYGTNDHFDSSVNATPTTWHLSWIDASGPTSVGDWEKFTVHVNVAGTYSIDFKMAEAYDPPNLQLLTFYNGTAVRVDSIKDLPKCITPQGCPEVWHAWTLMANVDTITLDTGLQVVKLAFVTGSWNFDWMRFSLKSASPVLSGVKNGVVQKGFDIKPVINGNNLAVSFSLMQAGPTTVSVFDCAGRAMAPAIVRNLNAGSQKQTINLGNISRGVYFVRVEQNGIKSVSPFNIQ
jgi:hypothetical protein